MLCPYHCLLFVMFSLRMFFFKEIKKLEFTPHEPQATCHRHRKNPRENLFRMYGHTSTLFSKNGAEKKKKKIYLLHNENVSYRTLRSGTC